MFSYQFYKILQNTVFLTEHPRVTAYEISDQKVNPFRIHVPIYFNTFENFAVITENKRVDWCKIG